MTSRPATAPRVCVLHTVAALPAVFDPLLRELAPRTGASPEAARARRDRDGGHRAATGLHPEDFSGATDLAGDLVPAEHRTALTVGPPTPDAMAHHGAVDTVVGGAADPYRTPRRDRRSRPRTRRDHQTPPASGRTAVRYTDSGPTGRTHPRR